VERALGIFLAGAVSHKRCVGMAAGDFGSPCGRHINTRQRQVTETRKQGLLTAEMGNEVGIVYLFKKMALSMV
jgi:hypothetical protein